MGRFLNSIFGSKKNTQSDSSGEEDVVVELKDVPQSDVGAPEPVLFSDEHKTVLGYRKLENIDWNTAKVEDLTPELAVIIEFKFRSALMFGPPNDGAINGHPLYEKGLAAYSAYEVQKSSWVRKLERMNSAHPNHDPKRFEEDRHFIFTFHDSTFECIAHGYEISTLDYSRMLDEMRKRLAS